MKKYKSTFCQSSDHDVSRRRFVGTLGAGVAGLVGRVGAVNALAEAPVTDLLKSTDKRVILLWLAGGASQLETWDPKPGRPTGGPFAAIPTSVPGVHISELMPEMAKRMDQLCLIRSLDTGDSGHGSARELMMHGRRNEPSLRYPDLGAVVARELAQANSKVPDYVSFYTATEGRDLNTLGGGFLGARYNAMKLTESPVPPNLSRLDSIDEPDHHARAELRDLLSHEFMEGRSTSSTRSHAAAYARVHGLMSSEELFDVSQEPEHVRKMYGPTLFGEQTMMARRMVEAGVPFVRVSRAWWDSHGQNFETHHEMVPELDRVMSALHDDLQQRGLLENTLVVAVGEFGRTPHINASLGRDHFSKAWSAAMFGCGVQKGAVYGATDKNGENVSDNPVNAGQLFATILEALGIRHDREYHVGARPVPLVNPGIEPVRAVLA